MTTRPAAAAGAADPSEAGKLAPSDSPPHSLPPGPSSSAGSSTAQALTWARDDPPVMPPSSAGGWSEVGQQHSSQAGGWNGALAPAAGATASSVERSHEVALQLAGTCSVPPKDHVQNASVPTVTDRSQLCPALPRTTICGPTKRPAPHNSAPAPAKKANANPYNAFCRERRPFLPPRLPNSERERRLSLQWKALSAAEKAMYRVQGGDALAQAPAPPTTPAPASSTFQQAAAAAKIWKVGTLPVEAETARPAPEASQASATFHSAQPLNAFVGPSHTPALAAPAAPHHLAAPPGTLLTAPTPNHSPAATLSDLAHLLERMIEEAGLEEEALSESCWKLIQ